MIFIIVHGAFPQCWVQILSDSIDRDTVKICKGEQILLGMEGECILLEDDFNTGTFGGGWNFCSPNVVHHIYCENQNPGNYVWFTSTVSPDRILETVDLDLTMGGYVAFDLKFALQNGPVGCEGPDEMLEGVSLQYSSDQGVTWTDIIYFCPDGTFLPHNPWVQAPLTMTPTQFTSWGNYKFEVPPAAQTAHTRFRWIQESTSYFSGHYDDNWGLDNIKVSRYIDQEVHWSFGSTSATPAPLNPLSSTTIYAYIVSYLNPTDTLTFDSLFILVHPVPEITFQGDSVICQGDTTTITAPMGYSITWNTGDTGHILVVAPPASSRYSLIATNGFGCHAQGSIGIIVHHLPVALCQGDTICPGDSAMLAAYGGQSYIWSNGFMGQFQLVSHSQSTQYSVTVSSAEGCTDTASSVVMVLSLPLVSLTDDTVMCLGRELLLQASGGVTYIWSTGDDEPEITVNPDDETIYYITVFNGNGCWTRDSVIVRIHPMEAISVVTSSDTICRGSPVTLKALGGSHYAWNTGHHEAHIKVFPEYTNLYTVTVSDVFEGIWCALSASVTVQVTECDNIFFANAFTPKGHNPVFLPKGDFTALYNYSLTIYDRWGRLLFESNNLEQGWDGTYGGEFVKQDVYMFRVRFDRTISGASYQHTGTVLVLY